MEFSLLVKVILTWLLFLPVPIINGLLREIWYKSVIGEKASHQVGVLVLSVVFLLYANVSLSGRAEALSAAELWGIGGIWLTLTIGFEFGLGFVTGKSKAQMLEEYNVFAGKIWPLVLMVTLLAPFIVKWIK